MLNNLKNLAKTIKQDFIQTFYITIRPKALHFYKDNRRRETDNNYTQFAYASHPIRKKKKDFRVGYQDSKHNIRYIDHSTAKKEPEKFFITNLNFSNSEYQGNLRRFQIFDGC